MSAFHSGFAARPRTGGVAGQSRRWRAVNRSGALKRAFARQALGTAGELPRLARASRLEHRGLAAASACWSIFAAQMKSFSLKPPIACVE